MEGAIADIGRGGLEVDGIFTWSGFGTAECAGVTKGWSSWENLGSACGRRKRKE